MLFLSAAGQPQHSDQASRLLSSCSAVETRSLMLPLHMFGAHIAVKVMCVIMDNQELVKAEFMLR